MSSKKSAWEFFSRDEIEEFTKDYKDFMGNVKTEREVVEELIKYAERFGFKNIKDIKNKLKSGDKVYATFKDKTAIFAVIGKEPLKEGLRLIAAHGDSPRLDLKPIPISEDKAAQLAYLSLGFYGGIVPYQWVNIPLEIRGIVATKNDIKKIRVKNLVITDLLPHLSRKRFEERKGAGVVKGEELKILLANTFEIKESKKSWKNIVLKYLKERYGIEEEDLISADLEVVPSFDPIDAGIDSSMVAAYGQDDRVCTYTGFKALLDAKDVKYTSVFWVVDKEEIGSETNTSAQSEFFKYFISKLLSLTEGFSEISLREVLLNTRAISADVGAVINPSFKGLYDVQNFAKMGNGVILEKYLNAAGKGGANEAHAEFVAWIRKILDERKVPWQAALLVSKAERGIGGGGTISKFMARLGMDVIDMGVGLLGMHSPYEISSKADIYSAYKAYKAFYEA